MTAEEQRPEASRQRTQHWKRWGPYLSERAWGTVREYYSAGGTAWEDLPHDHARSRAYRWNEEGIAGISDRHQKICFALALWNGRDAILKERMFGLTGNEGNYGEDVKECYYYLDSTPTHSYMKMLYKYPQAEFPYRQLVEENRRRGKNGCEFELNDTGIFDGNRCFDVFVEYAKAGGDDILARVTVCNRGPEQATLHVLPTIWFRNTWSWGDGEPKPTLRQCPSNPDVVELNEPMYGRRWVIFGDAPDLLFTENEINHHRLFGVENASPWVKDALHEYVVHSRTEAVNPARTGTKAAGHYVPPPGPGEERSMRVRLTDTTATAGMLDFDEIFEQRIAEGAEFYQEVIPSELSADAKNVMRQAFASKLADESC